MTDKNRVRARVKALRDSYAKQIGHTYDKTVGGCYAGFVRDLNTVLDNCFEPGCGNRIHTWECEYVQSYGRCLQHAEHPEKIGTFRKPTRTEKE